MNWEQIEGRWNEMKGRIRQKWGQMTDDDFEKIAGKKDQLLGWLQSKYGYTKEQAERELDEFGRSFEQQPH